MRLDSNEPETQVVQTDCSYTGRNQYSAEWTYNTVTQEVNFKLTTAAINSNSQKMWSAIGISRNKEMVRSIC